MNGQDLFQHSGLVMLLLDAAGHFTALNPAAERLFGRSAAELRGRPFSSVLDPFSHEKAELMIERTCATGGLVDWELDHLQAEGPPLLIGYTTSVLHDGRGACAGLAAVGRDLHSTLELTAALAQTNQQLEGTLLQLEKTHAALQATQVQLVQSEKMRALGQMVAGVAHEINNPVAFVISNLAHLAQLVPALLGLYAAYAPLRARADPAQQATLAAAEEAAGVEYLGEDLPALVAESQEGLARVRDIVLSLRNFARLDEADMKEADLNEGLRSTLQLVRPLCRDGVTLIEEYGPLPAVFCRPRELNQVFLNLLMNAVQAIADHGTIRVSTAHHGDTVTVTIHDTGAGMSAATLAHLGEPFFTTKPVGMGTGLGLAVSFGIVERHGGTLRFTSAAGAGTSAILEVPINHG